MPQSERSSILKEMVKWVSTQKEGVHTRAIISYTKWEITEGGATTPTIRKYIEDLDHAGFIVYRHPVWEITSHGKAWLDRHPR